MYNGHNNQEKFSLPSNEEVPLRPEEPHLHLHLGVEVAGHHPGAVEVILLAAVLLHLPDRVKEQKDQDGHKDVEVVHQLGLHASHQATSEDFVPHPALHIQALDLDYRIDFEERTLMR